MSRNLLTAPEVAARLGVRLETVYAYVSRGVLGRTLGPDGHTSRFVPAEVDALARRGRPRHGSVQVGTIDVSLATSITRVLDGRLWYRDHLATELAGRVSFERVAELLWTGALPDEARWTVAKPARKLARLLRDALPPAATPLDRFAALAAAMAPLFPLRSHVQPATVLTHARYLLATLPEVLPRSSVNVRPAATAEHDDLATRLHALFARRSAPAASAAQVRLVNQALVLLADHELATSTMAARVAASTRADPFAVVLAGFGALHGPLHGGAPLVSHRLLLDAEATEPDAALARALTVSPSRLAGFGHPVYTTVDPRAARLLDEIAAIATPKRRALLEHVERSARAATGAPPNSDFALAALAFVCDMALDASEAIFALARSAGFIAHALEEYQEIPLRFRARALYLGARGPVASSSSLAQLSLP